MACTVLVVACGDGAEAPLATVVIEAPASTELLTGDRLALVTTSSGDAGVLEWTTSDANVASVDASGVVEALRPGAVRISVGGTRVVGASIDLTVVQRPGGYTAQEIDYFTEIAFGAEFGTASALLRRWPASPGPRILVHGTPTAADLETLTTVRTEIGALTGLAVPIVNDAQTVDLHFIPVADFTSVLPQAPPGNVGVVWLWWGEDQQLVQSVVLIGSDIDATVRAHIIREEVTQMLGLLQDSFRYPESIFYQSPSTVTEYAPVDRVVIELLYRPELSLGMTTEEAAREARLLLRPQALLAEDGGSAPHLVGPGRIDGALQLGWRLEGGGRGERGSAGGSDGPRIHPAPQSALGRRDADAR